MRKRNRPIVIHISYAVCFKDFQSGDLASKL
jgi:hypothetical protein